MVRSTVDETDPKLSTTQVRLLGLIAGRRTNRQIAAETGLSPSTVKWNISQLLSKLDVANRHEAADWWRERHGVRRVVWRDQRTQEATSMAGLQLSSTFQEQPYSAAGDSLRIEEWRGSAPGELHVHHDCDIAWHVLEGILRFRVEDGEVTVNPGETIFFPAGTPHSYGEGDETRYLVIAPPKLFSLFQQLRSARMGRPHNDWGRGPDRAIYGKFDSELLES